MRGTQLLRLITATSIAATAISTAAVAAIIIGIAAGAATATALLGARLWNVTVLMMEVLAIVVLLVWREEFFDWECKAGEYFAGIFCAVAANAGIAAILLRHTDIICRHKQLNIALKLDDRELTDGNNELVAGRIQCKILTAEAAADRTRHFAQLTAAATVTRLGWVDNACVEQDCINRFEHSGWTVGTLGELWVHLILRILGREDAHTAFTAKQDAALVIDRKTLQNTRTTDTGACFYGYLVEEANIDAVKAALECNRLNVHDSGQQLCGAWFHTDRIAINKALIHAGIHIVCKRFIYINRAALLCLYI